MSNSAFTFNSSGTENNTFTGDRNVYVTQSIIASSSYQIYDWVPTEDCVAPGDILYRNRDTLRWDIATVDSEASAEALGVVEETEGCDSTRMAKIVYQGRMTLPNNYRPIDGAVYFLAAAESTDIGPFTIRNATTTEPETISKPMYVGAGGKTINVVNHRALSQDPETTEVPVVPRGNYAFTQTCFVDGVVFTITNDGSADITSSVDYAGYNNSAVFITGSTGTIPPLDLGESAILSFTGSLSMPAGGFVQTDTAITHLQRTEYSACSI